MIFYPASAEHRWATHHDIIPDKTFASYDEARSFVLSYGHDSDDVVFVQINGEWAMAWGYDKQGRLLVCREHEGASSCVPIDEFIARQGV